MSGVAREGCSQGLAARDRDKEREERMKKSRLSNERERENGTRFSLASRPAS